MSGRPQGGLHADRQVGSEGWTTRMRLAGLVPLLAALLPAFGASEAALPSAETALAGRITLSVPDRVPMLTRVSVSVKGPLRTSDASSTKPPVCGSVTADMPDMPMPSVVRPLTLAGRDRCRGTLVFTMAGRWRVVARLKWETAQRRVTKWVWVTD